MPNIKGRKVAYLQPGDTKVPIRIDVTVNTGDSTDDGWLWSGAVLSTATAKVYNSVGVDVSSDIIYTNPIVSGTYVDMEIKYPITNGDGTYLLDLSTTISGGATKTIYARRIIARSFTNG